MIAFYQTIVSFVYFRYFRIRFFIIFFLFILAVRNVKTENMLVLKFSLNPVYYNSYKFESCYLYHKSYMKINHDEKLHEKWQKISIVFLFNRVRYLFLSHFI